MISEERPGGVEHVPDEIPTPDNTEHEPKQPAKG